jgi:hypothetical protein
MIAAGLGRAESVGLSLEGPGASGYPPRMSVTDRCSAASGSSQVAATGLVVRAETKSRKVPKLADL